MIRRARIRRVPTPIDVLDRLLSIPCDASEHESEEDESLEVLLKHALRPTATEPGRPQVWQRLTRMMRGPFGGAALEGPDQSSLEVELISTGGWSNPVPFATPVTANRTGLALLRGRESVWNLLRFDQLGLPQRGCNAMLS